jgi:hypothetical protein
MQQEWGDQLAAFKAHAERSVHAPAARRRVHAPVRRKAP